MLLKVSKAKTLALCRSAVKQTKFKYVEVVFTGDRKFEKEIDWRIGAATNVLSELARTVVTKGELSQQTKLSVFKSVFTPMLIYLDESWTITEKFRPRVQAAEMDFGL